MKVHLAVYYCIKVKVKMIGHIVKMCIKYLTLKKNNRNIKNKQNKRNINKENFTEEKQTHRYVCFCSEVIVFFRIKTKHKQSISK